MDLSIVVVHYRSPEHLFQCLDALEAGAGGLSKETVVVDNDSRDDTPEVLARRFPQVRTIRNDDNVGYARAVNQGTRATSGEFVVALNPDCVVTPGALATMVAFLRDHPSVAIAGPKTLNPDGSLEYSARSFPDHLTFLFNRYSLLTRLFPNNPYSRRYLLTDWDHATVREVDWVSGSCMMVRRAAIERAGPMDEAFFMFNEDVDWCRAMRLAGFGVCYVPDAVVVHHIGASRGKVGARVIVGRHLGMIHYFHKHHPTHPVLAFFTDAMIMMRAGLMMAANALRLR
jgi:GT2 family glycosyltransferase